MKYICLVDGLVEFCYSSYESFYKNGMPMYFEEEVEANVEYLALTDKEFNKRYPTGHIIHEHF